MIDYSIHQGDVLEWLRDLPDNMASGLLSDPPYGLSFMGKRWDHGVPSAEVWAEAVRNSHPTVKPIALAEYLARLIVPPKAHRDDATLLVPFSGSGSEMIGAMLAGWQHIQGCESEPEYIEIAEARLHHWIPQQMALF